MAKSKKNLYMKRARRSRKMMRGGQLTQDDVEHLLNVNGFTQEQIDDINENNISMDVITQAINEYQTNPHQLIDQ